MLQVERMRKVITELSREMIAWKRQWLNLARTNEQEKQEDTVEELKGDYQHTEHMMKELDSILFGISFDSVYHDFSLNSKIV